LYVITEYQYQQLRNSCKESFVDEIGRQPIKKESQTTEVQKIKAEILPIINSIRVDLNRDSLNSFYTNRACDNLDVVVEKLSAV